MIQKIIKQLNELSSFSKNIIKWGSLFSLAMCIMGAVIIEYNQLELNKILVYQTGSTMIYTGIVAFAQFVIGSLLIDYFGKLVSNHG